MNEQSQKLKNNQAKNNHFKEEDLLILKELTANPQLTQRDLSRRLGVSLGKVNYLLKELTLKGMVEIKNFTTGDHKLDKICYLLTPEGLKHKAELTFHFLKLKEEEYEKLRKEWEALKK